MHTVAAMHMSYFYGLLSSRDPMLVKRIGEATALEVRATGISYVFAPCIAVTDNTSCLLNALVWTSDYNCVSCCPSELIYVLDMILPRFVETQDGDAAMKAIARTQRLSSQ